MSSKYFSNFPKIYYTDFSEDNNHSKIVTNLTSLWKVDDNLKNNQFAFNTMTIDEFDRPDVVASKEAPLGYNSSQYHWAVLMFNDIVNPYYDWVMPYNVFNKYIESKYSQPEYADTANTNISGLDWSQSNIKSYYFIEKITTSDGNYTKENIEVNFNDYANVEVVLKQVTLPDGEIVEMEVYKETETYYEYENKINEEKKKIKLLKPELVHALLNEIENAFKK